MRKIAPFSHIPPLPKRSGCDLVGFLVGGGGDGERSGVLFPQEQTEGVLVAGLGCGAVFTCFVVAEGAFCVVGAMAYIRSFGGALPEGAVGAGLCFLGWCC